MAIYFDWSKKKNEWLKQERDISFEEIVHAIDENRLLDVIPHNNKDTYVHQFIYIAEVRNYVYAVPFVKDTNKHFFKTIISDQKATKRYLS